MRFPTDVTDVADVADVSARVGTAPLLRRYYLCRCRYLGTNTSCPVPWEGANHTRTVPPARVATTREIDAQRNRKTNGGEAETWIGVIDSRYNFENKTTSFSVSHQEASKA